MRDVVDVWFREPAGTQAMLRDVRSLGARGAEFSVSRSGGVAVVALAGTPVGVDVERIREVPRAQRIAERWLPAVDAREVAAAGAAHRALAFLHAWVAAEALVKGWGAGIPDLARVRDTIRVAGDGRRVALAPDGTEWTAMPVAAPPGYVAAAAAPGRGWSVVVN